jgi:hypothetical protein
LQYTEKMTERKGGLHPHQILSWNSIQDFPHLPVHPHHHLHLLARKKAQLHLQHAKILDLMTGHCEGCSLAIHAKMHEGRPTKACKGNYQEP